MAKEKMEENQRARASEAETAQAPETQDASSAEEMAEEAAAQDAEADEAADADDAADAAEDAQETQEASDDAAQAEPDTKDEKIRELNDRLLRQMAEFDNFRRRTEKEKTMMFETGASSVIEKLLPVVDNFERAMATLSDEQKADPFVEGMDKIYKQLLTMLEQLQVTPIEALGNEFDPQLHNAVMHVEDETYGENEVIEEFQKGYKYRDNVVRHSMVKVAN